MWGGLLVRKTTTKLNKQPRSAYLLREQSMQTGKKRKNVNNFIEHLSKRKMQLTTFGMIWCTYMGDDFELPNWYIVEVSHNYFYWPVPGPPSDLKIYAFGEYIFVTWKLPQDPNGIVTSYQVGSQEYSGSVVEKAPVSMETVQPDVFEKLLGKLAFEKSYVVEVRAQTSKGWGESVRKIVTTVKRSGEFRAFKLFESSSDSSVWLTEWLASGRSTG